MLCKGMVATFTRRNLWVAVSVVTLLLAPVPGNAAQSTSPSRIADRITSPIDDADRVTLPGNIPPMARPEFDRGVAPGATRTGSMFLVLRKSDAQEKALAALLAQLQDPASPQYHRWLTPDQFGATFGVSDADIQAIEQWLQSYGLKVEDVPIARNLIRFSGSFAQIQNAFRTEMHVFQVNGERHFANVRNPQIPAALAAVVAGVFPLNDFHSRPQLVRGRRTRFNASNRTIRPDLTDSNGNLLMTPADAATIYDTPNPLLNPAYNGTTYDGSGVTIGIIGRSNITRQDVLNYRMAFLGETAAKANLPTVVLANGIDPGIVSGGDAQEALLDNEIAGGLAPGARIVFYTAPTDDMSDGIDYAITRAINDNLVGILSVSFGECESSLGGGNALIASEWAQAAAQGMTVVVAAGDSGSATCDGGDNAAYLGLAVSGIASTPYNIAVGGTDFLGLWTDMPTYVDTSSMGAAPYYRTAKSYIPEAPWNDSVEPPNDHGLANNIEYEDNAGNTNTVAGGGGASSLYPKPDFQTALTPSDKARDLPDVSLMAGDGIYFATWLVCSDDVSNDDPSGPYTDCETSNGQLADGTYFDGIGGTSAAAPAFAGLMALVEQSQGGQRLGQADVALYQLAQSKYAAVFHDITQGNNSVYCVTGDAKGCQNNTLGNPFTTGYDAAKGYDLASGLGSIDAAQLVKNWSAAVVPSGPGFSLLSDNSMTIAAGGGSGSAHLTLTPSNGFTGQVNFACSIAGSPAGVTCSAPSASVTGASSVTVQLTITTTAATPGGTFTATVTASDAATGAITSTAYQVVNVPGLALTAGEAVTVPSGNSGTSTVSVTPEAGFSGNVNLACSANGAPAGISCSADSVQVSGLTSASSSVTVNTASSTAGGAYTLAISASDAATGKVTASTALDLYVEAPGIVLLPGVDHLSISSGSSATDTLTVRPAYGFTGDVNISCSAKNAPVGLTCSAPSTTIVNPSASATSTLTVGTTAATPAGTYTVTITASDAATGKITNSTWITVVVSAAHFYVTVGNTISVNDGNSATATLSVQSLGFSGTVNFTCAVNGGTPKDLTCSAPPMDVTGEWTSGTLTVGTAADTPTGSYYATVTATDATTGKITDSNIAQITVNPAGSPSFTLSNSGNMNLTAGTNGSNTLTITPSGGFTGYVNVECEITGLAIQPAGLSCSLPSMGTLNVPGSSAVTDPLTITLPVTMPNGTFSVILWATDQATGKLSARTEFSLTVTGNPGSFSLGGYSTITVAAGSTASTPITVTPSGGFTGKVSFTCTNAAVPCSVPPVTITGNAPVSTQLTASPSASLVPNPQGYVATVTAADSTGKLTATANVGINVTDPANTFTLSNSGGITVAPGKSGANVLTVTPGKSFNSPVYFSAVISGAPAGLSWAAAAVNVDGSPATTSFAVTTTALTPAGSYTATVNAYDQTYKIFASTTFLIVVTTPGNPGLSIAGSGDVALTAGKNGTTGLTVTPLGGFTGQVNIACTVSGAPAGIGCSAPAVNITGAAGSNSTLTVTTSASAAGGIYTASVLASDAATGKVTASTTVRITVTAAQVPGFALANSAPITVSAGQSGSSTLTVTPSNAFTGQVAFGCVVAGAPAGLNCSAQSADVIGPQPVTSTLNVATASTTPVGTYSATVTAKDAATGKISASTTVQITVNAAPSFTMSIGGSITVTAVTGSSGTSIVTVTPQGGFAGEVDLSCAVGGSPSGLNCSVSPVNVAGSPATSTLLVTAGPSTPAGTYSATIKGSDAATGTITATTVLQITVNPGPALELAVSGPITVTAGDSGSATLTVTPSNGFKGQVDFTCSIIGSPAGASCSAAPLTISGVSPSTSTLQLATTSSTPAGSYTAQVRAADDLSGNITANATIQITINSGPTAATPTFAPAAGTYDAAQAVTISDATAGAAIYYTTDGSTPTTSSTLYSGPVKVAQSETVKAIATAKGYAQSAVATAAYTIEQPAATPGFNPPAGTYNAAQAVTISDATAGAAIYYTTDGSTPTTSSTLYSGPVKVAQSETVKAIATAKGYAQSAVATAAYTITQPAATPAFNPPAGTYNAAQMVTLSDATAGAAIYYTTDGSAPTTSSTLYSGPVKVAQSETVKAIATAKGYTQSAVGAAAYAISLPAPSVTVTPESASITTAQPLSVSVSVAAAKNAPTPTGTITLSSGSYSAQQPLSAGSAAFSITAGVLPAGSVVLTAAYAPDTASAGYYMPASGSATITVSNPIGTAAATITVTPSAGTIIDEQALTVAVSVAGAPGQSAPTGSLTLTAGSYSATQSLGAAQLSFQVPANSLPLGSNTISAAYSGDSLYAAATGTSSVTVVPVEVSTTNPPAVSPGSSATATLTFDAGSSYSGTMNLTCALSSSPTGAQNLPTCSLNPASVTLAAGKTATSTLTMKTTAPSTTARLSPLGRFGGGAALAVLLLVWMPSRRHRWFYAVLLLAFGVAIAGAGCGGGQSAPQPPPISSPGTTPGSYTFTISGVDSANSGITASTTITMSVQ